MKELFDGKGINFEELPDGFVIILDSTGLRLSDGGEWQNKKHKTKSRKGWMKWLRWKGRGW